MLLILYGKTGSGKDYLASVLAEDFLNFYQIKRPTTRPKRSESELEYYKFYTDEEFDKANLENNEILFPKVYAGWQYGIFKGISAQARDKDDFYILTVEKQAAFEVADLVRENGGLVYVVEVSAAQPTRLLRALRREDNPDEQEIKRRMEADDVDYAKNTRLPDFYFASDDDNINFQCSLNSLKTQLRNISKHYKEGENK